ncbi:MAG: nickel pincer cofactor biosynthesis protein LarC [Myxococcales bacterium]
MSGVLCLEPVGGIAGDMFLALCLDLGVPQGALEAQLALLPLAGYRLEASRAVRHEITGTHLDVVIDAPPGGHAHRAWADIRAMIGGSGLAARVKARALSIFERIAVAEAHVHGVSVETVHFHEVGAVDSIVDVVGAAIAVELLGEPEIYCAPPPMGSGLIRSAHGMTPIPPPATVEILKARTVRFEGVGELTTPTGAALVAALTRDEPFPPLKIAKVGYGVGTKDFRDRPNVLRGLLAERVDRGAGELWVLEANLDDATPQLLAFALERALEAGALDAWIAPVTMKKGRPGHLLGVLVRNEKREVLTQLLLAETPTLGVRAHAVERVAAERRFETVQTVYGAVSVKIGSVQGRDTNATPEYEDCARLAREQNVPLKELLAAAVAALRTNGR